MKQTVEQYNILVTINLKYTQVSHTEWEKNGLKITFYAKYAKCFPVKNVKITCNFHIFHGKTFCIFIISDILFQILFIESGVLVSRSSKSLNKTSSRKKYLLHANLFQVKCELAHILHFYHLRTFRTLS